MLATDSFTMRISPSDKAMLGCVARHLQQSQADVIKTLVREMYQVIKTEKIGETKPAQEQPAA